MSEIQTAVLIVASNLIAVLCGSFLYNRAIKRFGDRVNGRFDSLEGRLDRLAERLDLICDRLDRHITKYVH